MQTRSIDFCKMGVFIFAQKTHALRPRYMWYMLQRSGFGLWSLFGQITLPQQERLSCVAWRRRLKWLPLQSANQPSGPVPNPRATKRQGKTRDQSRLFECLPTGKKDLRSWSLEKKALHTFESFFNVPSAASLATGLGRPVPLASRV